LRIKEHLAGAELRFDNAEFGIKGLPLRLVESSQLALDLGSPEIAQLVAMSLLYRLPVAVRFDKSFSRKTTDGTWIVSMPYKRDDFRQRLPAPDAPAEFTLYRLAWDRSRRTWAPQIAGKAKRIKVVDHVASYRLDRTASQALDREPLWGHDISNLAKRMDPLSESVRSARESTGAGRGGFFSPLRQALLDTTASGYVGLRYGLEIAKGDALIEKMRFFGLLGEIRGGPLNGLRYYYDSLPETTVTEPSVNGDQELFMTWARHQIAYALEFDPGLLVDRLSLVPKLGVWNLSANAAVSRNEAGLVQKTRRFDVDQALGLGIELGIEQAFDETTVRLWAGYERGLALSAKGAQVFATRGGLDLLVAVGPPVSLGRSEFRTALLAFVLGEQVVIRASSTREANEDSEGTEVRGFGYGAAFSGLGLVLTW
jgi:hypothetical protein